MAETLKQVFSDDVIADQKLLYEQHCQQRHVMQARFISLLGIALYIGYMSTSKWFVESNQQMVLHWVMPSLLFYCGLTFIKPLQKIMQQITLFVFPFSVGGGEVYAMYLDPDRIIAMIGGTVICLVALYTALKLEFRYAIATGVLFSILCIVAALHLVSDPMLLDLYMINLAMTNIFIGYVSYMLSNSWRKDYDQRLQIENEQQISEKLLLNVLPEPVALRLKGNEKSIADHYENVSVLFADLAGFTTLASQREPEEVVSILNDIFSRFDLLCDRLGVEKIKTMGDCYMAVCGLPQKNDKHAMKVLELAQQMFEAIAAVNRERGLNLNLRIGINSGPVVAGVIGKKKFIYDLWGDTVNIASRMESSGQIGMIQMTEATAKLVDQTVKLHDLGTVEVKGRGDVHVFSWKAA